MYKYKIDKYYEIIIPEISAVYIPVNNQGFADILSINLENTIKLKKTKNKIDSINHCIWEDMKKYTNPYELIYIFNNNKIKYISSSTTHAITHNDTHDNTHDNTHTFKEINNCGNGGNSGNVGNSGNSDNGGNSVNSGNSNNGGNSGNSVNSGNEIILKSIAMIKPLSRSFFKMIEIINEFIPNIKNICIFNSLHIAEGPGGFIEATRYIRNTNNKNNKNNVYLGNMPVDSEHAFGITLIDNAHKNVPAWKQSVIFLKKHPEVIITTGYDGTGNIYNINNINYLETVFLKYAIDSNIDSNNDCNVIDFITADGGFDYSIDYNYQEQASSKLIFSEIITALKYQKKGGDFVCKFFDINAYLTIEMLYILYISYDEIIIYKPYTSRIANSEKYIICNNFTGINKEFLQNLFNILKIWHSKPNYTINQLFVNIPNSFIDKFKEINTILINNQIQSINNIINIVNNKTNLKKDWKNNMIHKQIQHAIAWCKQYNIPYNTYI